MATFTKCPNQVLSIAKELVALYHPILRNCNIGFVMRSEASTSGGKTVLAQTSKIPDKVKPYLHTELDILIVIAEDQWANLDTLQRTALIDHELCHITVSKSGWTTRAHDIDEFVEIIQRHGLWNGDLFGARTTLSRASEAGQLSLFSSERLGSLVSLTSEDAGKMEQE